MVIGPTGAGKSTLLLNLIAQDLAAGAGMVVIDPKGDLIADCLERVPRHREREVIVLDPSDDDRPVGFNLLAPGPGGSELLVDQVIGIFGHIFKRFWGPRTDDILRAALLTLAAHSGFTLCEVPLLLTEPGFRQRLVGGLDDPILASFWGWYEGLSAGERAAAIGPVMNKLRAVLLRRRIRHVVGQVDAGLDFERVVRDGQVLFVSLPKGLLGEEASALVGSLVLARLWQAVQGRANQLVAERRPILCCIDEVQDFLTLPTDIGDLLAQARSLGLGLTLAHQHLGQLPRDLRSGVLANARSKVVFQTSADDARSLAREFEPHLTALDLQGLGAYEVAVKVAVGGRVSDPVTGLSFPAPPASGRAPAIRRLSRARFGRDGARVEAAIRARHQLRTSGGPVGRRRRDPDPTLPPRAS